MEPALAGQTCGGDLVLKDVTLFQGTDGEIIEVWGCPATQTSRALAVLQELSSEILNAQGASLTELYRSNSWIRVLINEILDLHRLSPDNLTINQIEALIFYYEDADGTTHPGLLKQLDLFVAKEPSEPKPDALDPCMELLAGLVSLGLARDLLQAREIMGIYSLAEIQEIVSARQRQMDPKGYEKQVAKREADEAFAKHAPNLFRGVPKFDPNAPQPVDPDEIFSLV